MLHQHHQSLNLLPNVEVQRSSVRLLLSSLLRSLAALSEGFWTYQAPTGPVSKVHYLIAPPLKGARAHRSLFVPNVDYVDVSTIGHRVTTSLMLFD